MKLKPKNPKVMVFVFISAVFLLAGVLIKGFTLAVFHFAIVPIAVGYIGLVKPGGFRNIKWPYIVYFLFVIGLVVLYMLGLSRLYDGVGFKLSEIWYAGYFLLAIHLVAWLVDAAINKSVSYFMRVSSCSALACPKVCLRRVSKNVVRFVFSGLIILPYVMAMFTVHWVKLKSDVSVFDGIGFECSQVKFQSEDRVMIDGWMLEAPYCSDSTVIMAHGQDLPKITYIRQAMILQNRGFNVLLIDIRGKGDSGGHTRTFGKDEYKDVLAAVDYLEANYPDSSKNLFGLGISDGAMAVVKAATYNARIEAVAVDSIVTEIKSLPIEVSKILPGFVSYYLNKTSLLIASAETGENLFKSKLDDYIVKLGSRPLVIMHGKEDKLSSAESVQKIFEQAEGLKHISIIDGAGHGQPMIFGEAECFYNMLSVFNTARFSSHNM